MTNRNFRTNLNNSLERNKAYIHDKLGIVELLGETSNNGKCRVRDEKGTDWIIQFNTLQEIKKGGIRDAESIRA